jgi:hypothetical protein
MQKALITNTEKGDFLHLFTSGGCIINFANNEFDIFTMRSIGRALCAHYKLPKVKSLNAYILEAEEQDVIKLFSDLLEYYEINYHSEIEKDKTGNSSHGYYKCRAIMDRIKQNIAPFASVGETLKELFSSDYFSAQIDIMIKMQNENPTEAIGKSKELIESCCKTILENNQVPIKNNSSVSELVKKTMEYLDVLTDNVTDTMGESKTIKSIIGNLHGIAGNIAELRNAYGSGHGKSASFRGLTARHAKLAVGTSITLVQYLWETYEWKKQSGKKNTR